MESGELEKFNPEALGVPLEREMTQEEREFIKLYMQYKNATRAYSEAFAFKHPTPGSCKVLGARLVRKFGLKGKRNPLKEVKTVRLRDEQKDRVVARLKQAYKNGEIDVNKLFSEMKYLAYNEQDPRVRFMAVKELKLWYEQMQEELKASTLEGIDVVDLFCLAFSNLPHEKYVEVLKRAKVERREIRKKRSTPIDDAAIIAREKQIRSEGSVTNVEN